VKPLLVATRNRGKLRELVALFGPAGVTCDSLADHPEVGDVDETGRTFEENARLKASAAARACGHWALGEDSGLEVDALGGAPGVFSARYAGSHGNDAANNSKLLAELAGRADRAARYRCAMALARPDGDIVATTAGTCEGRIAEAPRGGGGFGYDPLFVPDGRNLTMAELSPAEKDALSHRGRAARAMRPLLALHLG
jgi:XTP/dITP diphosphohydrolase